MRMIDNRRWNESRDCRIGKGSASRSLGEDTRVAHVAGSAQRTCANGRDITKKVALIAIVK